MEIQRRYRHGSCVAGLATIFWAAGQSKSGLPALIFTSPAMAFFIVAIGLHLFYKGAWIAEKLVKVDESTDL